MKIFRFYLTKYPNKKKTIEIKADNTDVAFDYIKMHYVNWDVSMFWPVWP